MFDDVKAVKLIQRINSGGTEMLSKSQIVNCIVNMSDISKVNSKEITDQCYELFKKYRQDKSKELYDKEKYLRVSMDILNEFDMIIFHKETREMFEPQKEEDTLSEKEITYRALYDDIISFAKSDPFIPKGNYKYEFLEICAYAAVKFNDHTVLKLDVADLNDWYLDTLSGKFDEVTIEQMLNLHDQMHKAFYDTIQKVIDTIRGTELEDELPSAIAYAAAISTVFPSFINVKELDLDLAKKIYINPEDVVLDFILENDIPSEQFKVNVNTMASFLLEHFDSTVVTIIYGEE